MVQVQTETPAGGTTPPGPAAPAPAESGGLPPGFRLLQPLVNRVAELRIGIHGKLLTGFLLGALLLLAMGGLSLLVMNEMHQRVAVLLRLQELTDRARQMEYEVTSQSHYRAMALLTRDATNNAKIATAKQDFLTNLDRVTALSPAAQAPFFAHVRDVNAQYAASGVRVLALDQAGHVDAALQLHLAEEHPISHQLEIAMRDLEKQAGTEMAQAHADYEAEHSLLTTTVVVCSLIGLALATFLGAILAWAFIQPVRQIGTALTRIAAGEFGLQVAVRNRDEFAVLSRDLNAASNQLADLYTTLRATNAAQEQELGQFAVLTEAAAALEVGTFAPESIAAIATRADAMGGLARVFSRMASEVQAREQRLQQQLAELRVEVDHARLEREVSSITESDFFTDLQRKAAELRGRRRAAPAAPGGDLP